MATRVDLANKLQSFFNNPTFYDTQSMNDTIQDGCDEICAFTGCIYKSAVIPFVAGKTYYDLAAILPDYIGVVAIFNSAIRRFMIPSSLKKFDQFRIDWDTCGGTPYYFCPINFRYVAINFKPLASGYGNMIVYYRAAAPTLTDSTAIPILDEHLTVLEQYGQVDLWESAQEWQKAQRMFEDSYAPSLDNLRVLVRNQRNPDRMMSLK